MKAKKAAALLTAASSLLMAGCSSIIDSGYVGYKKNEMKFGNTVKQFDNAISHGNIEWLDEILADNPDFDVNYCGNIMREYFQAGNYQHETLQIVSSYGMLSTEKRRNMLEFLLKNGLDPNIKYANGNYALEDCCGTVLAETLLNNNADPNINNGEVIKELIYDVWDRPIEQYIDNGAKLTAGLFENIYTNSKPVNPSAFQYAYKKFIEDKNSSPFSKAEEYAVLGENEKLIEAISSESLNNSQLKTVSYFAYCFGDEKVLKALNDKYSESDMSIPTIDIIVNTGNADAFKYLYSKGELGVYKEEFLLYLAVNKNHTEIIDFLIEKNVPIEKRLISALYECGNMKTVKKVSEYMKRKNMLDEHAFYDFDVSMTMNDFTKDFIDYFMTEHGLSLQQLSFKNTDFLTAEYLFDNGRPLSGTDLENSMYKGDTDMVNMVLQKGADPNQPKLEGYYITVYAGEKSNFDKLLVPYVKIINSAGEVAATNNDFDNCWYDAIVYGNSEIVQLMIDNGLSLDNEKLLYYAIRYGSSAVFNTLYEAGASTEYRFDLGQETLVDAAKSMGRDDIVKILKKAGVKAYKR